MLGGLLVLEAQQGSVSPDTAGLAQVVTSAILGTFGARMAAVFTLSVTTVGLRTAVVPRWLAVLGYAVAVVLLLSPPISGWAQLLFPGWVLVLSVYILSTSARSGQSTAASPDPVG